MIELHHGDCLELLKTLPENSVDMVFTDLPYGITGLRWDSVIPFDEMWSVLLPKVKERGAIVFPAGQPFASALVMSNPKLFRCEWIWKKTQGSNFACVKRHPFREHESLLIFGKKGTNYYPIKEPRTAGGLERITRKTNERKGYESYDGLYSPTKEANTMPKLRYPSSVQTIPNRKGRDRGLHPTQKPIELCEYFIKTYSREGETVLDFTMGSGSTGVACINTNRAFIGIEKDDEYFQVASERINARYKNGD